MRLLIRLVAIVTALSFAGAAPCLPCRWCGASARTAIAPSRQMHQQGMKASDPSPGELIATGSHSEPCSDWQLLSTAGPPQVKSPDVEPKPITVLTAYPPLKLVVDAAFPAHGARHTVPYQPRPGAHLCALRSVVLLI